VNLTLNESQITTAINKYLIDEKLVPTNTVINTICYHLPNLSAEITIKLSEGTEFKDIVRKSYKDELC